MKEQPPQRLTEMARQAVSDLREKGVEPSLNDVVLLNDLAREVEHPVGGSTLPAGTPVAVGGVWLWPLTILSSHWWETRASKWFVDDPQREAYAIAYALAHGRTLEPLTLLVRHNAAEEAVEEWAHRLTCTNDELRAAIHEVCGPQPWKPEYVKRPIGDDDDDTDTPAPDRFAELIAMLCANGLGPPEIWECKVSKDYALYQIQAIVRQQQAMSGSDSVSVRHPTVSAQGDFLLCIKDIEARAKAEATNG